MKYFLLVRRFFPVIPDNPKGHETVYDDPVIQQLLTVTEEGDEKIEIDTGVSVYNVDHIVGVSEHADNRLSIIELDAASLFVIVAHPLVEILKVMENPKIVTDIRGSSGEIKIIKDLIGDISNSTNENKYRLWRDDFNAILLKNGVKEKMKENTCEFFYKMGITPFNAYKETQRID